MNFPVLRFTFVDEYCSDALAEALRAIGRLPCSAHSPIVSQSFSVYNLSFLLSSGKFVCDRFLSIGSL